MRIRLNDQDLDLDAQLTLDQLLVQCGWSQVTGLAVAINEVVVPKRLWPETQIAHQDSIVVLQATQGG